MKISVLFFAQLADLAGTRLTNVTLQEGSLGELMGQINTAFSADLADALRAENVKIARNQELWDGKDGLADGDEVAFLPPVTGG